MDVRTATETDFNSILNLINAAFQIERFFLNQNRLTAAELESHFKTGTFLVSEDAGQMTGCVFVKIDGERAYFGLLSVDPLRQKTGVGRRLVAAAEEFARELGARFMDLTVVNLRTELPAIYAKLGYEVTGQKPFPPEGIHKLSQPVYLKCMSKELGHRP
jgi:N-acetylglutamate synthase-like GNAT family acetyltransferase